MKLSKRADNWHYRNKGHILILGSILFVLFGASVFITRKLGIPNMFNTIALLLALVIVVWGLKSHQHHK